MWASLVSSWFLGFGGGMEVETFKGVRSSSLEDHFCYPLDPLEGMKWEWYKFQRYFFWGVDCSGEIKGCKMGFAEERIYWLQAWWFFSIWEACMLCGWGKERKVICFSPPSNGLLKFNVDGVPKRKPGPAVMCGDQQILWRMLWRSKKWMGYFLFLLYFVIVFGTTLFIWFRKFVWNSLILINVFKFQLPINKRKRKKRTFDTAKSWTRVWVGRRLSMVLLWCQWCWIRWFNSNGWLELVFCGSFIRWAVA